MLFTPSKLVFCPIAFRAYWNKQTPYIEFRLILAEFLVCNHNVTEVFTCLIRL